MTLHERLLIVDNYDSFTYNLQQLVWTVAGEEPLVLRNDAVDAQRVAQERPRAVIISPGPGRPEAAGNSEAIIACCRREGIPLLGVCLGHQAVGQVYGGRIELGAEPVHGKVYPVVHQGKRLLRELPNPFEATRYHSLVVAEEGLPEELEILARTPDGVIMALADRSRPIYGVQFHPESIATEAGARLMANFLSECPAASPTPPEAG